MRHFAIRKEQNEWITQQEKGQVFPKKMVDNWLTVSIFFSIFTGTTENERWKNLGRMVCFFF